MKRKAVKNKKSRFGGAISLMTVFAIVLLVTIKLYQMFSVDLMMKDLHELEQKKTRLLSETASLEAEVQRLKNIDRITRIATKDLGLVTNTEDVLVLQLKDQKEMQQLANQFHEKKRKYNVAGVR